MGLAECDAESQKAPILKRWVQDSGGKVVQFFSKNGGNILIIRKTDIGKICNSKPLSHHENTEFEFPVKTHPCGQFCTSMTNSKRNSSAQLTC